jgi:tRNA(fMet)-specific endonuclease VapC
VACCTADAPGGAAVLVLDSDLMSILLRGPASERSRLMDWIKRSGDDAVAVTIVTFQEQMRGWLAVIAKAKTPQQQVAGYARLHALLRDYQRLPVLDLSDAAAQTFAALRRQYRRHGAADLRIAAIAITAGATLLSRNVRDFRPVEGLAFRDPLAK